MIHTPLHLLPCHETHTTAGRLRKVEHRWCVFNAFCEFTLQFSEHSPCRASLVDGALVRLRARRTDEMLVVESIDVVHTPGPVSSPHFDARNLSLGVALRARHELYRRIHAFFASRDFLEVRTRAWLKAPGTDPHLDPVPAGFREAPTDEATTEAYLHTSPELPMKRLLCAGAGPIYQLGRAWRNGEVTPLHNPEFDLLEWYRPWLDMDAIITDVEQLVCTVLDDRSDRPVVSPIPRMTMQQVVHEACGFDILTALSTDSLRREIRDRGLLSDRAISDAPWDELFFSLTLSHIDPYLEEQGALFVTHWPRPLAILARRDEEDPRVAERFELYVDGVELANGFGELTDSDEQRRRFADDNERRLRLGLHPLPMPEAFLNALQWGLPPSAGVALGVDRLLMLATAGAKELRDIQPFALCRDDDGIHWDK